MVFCSRKGTALEECNFARRWYRLRRRAKREGIRPLKLHATRHTWATLALQSGKSVRWVADQLGHADPALTLRVYAHVIPDEDPDLSFLAFGDSEEGSERLYPAPGSTGGDQNGDVPAVSDRGVSGSPGAPGTTRTCDLQVRKPKKG